MTDKEIIKAEIERHRKIFMYNTGKHSFGRMIECNDLLVFINSLPEEPVSEDLEEAAKRYATEGNETSGVYIIDEKVEAFKAGAKWQKKQFELLIFKI